MKKISFPGLTIGVLNQCIKEALLSTCKLKVGAVLFKGKRILSSGHNKNTYSKIYPKYQDYLNSVHAEQDAVLGLNWKSIYGCNLIVLRINKSGKLSESRPCDKCYALLKHIGIKRVYYSVSSGEIHSCLLNDLVIKSFRKNLRRGFNEEV